MGCGCDVQSFGQLLLQSKGEALRGWGGGRGEGTGQGRARPGNSGNEEDRTRRIAGTSFLCCQQKRTKGLGLAAHFCVL